MKKLPLFANVLLLFFVSSMPAISTASEKPIDFFARAVHTWSSAPLDVLVTIVDDRSGASKKVCLPSDLLVDAELAELRLSRSWSDRAKAEALLLRRSDRVYHFRNPKALADVSALYSEAQLSQIRTALTPYTDQQLLVAFHSPLHGNAITATVEPGNGSDRMMAVAHVLMERGFQTYNPDMFFGVGIVTAEDVRRENADDEARRVVEQQEQRKAKTLGSHLRGFEQIQRQFLVDFRYGWINGQPESLWTDMTSRRPALIDSVSWCNPVDVHGKPTFGWKDCVDSYRDAGNIVRRVSWISRWKRAYPKASIELTIIGRRPIESIDDGSDAWKRAKYSGRPTVELMLDRKLNCYARAWIDRRGRSVIEDYCGPEPNETPKPNVITDNGTERRRYGTAFRSLGDNYYAP